MATLEELNYADILLHVIDSTDENYLKHIDVVEQILKELELLDKPRIMIFNKIDGLENEALSGFYTKFSDAVFISATKNLGLSDLINACINKIANLNISLNYEFNEKEFEEVFFDERDI